MTGIPMLTVNGMDPTIHFVHIKAVVEMEEELPNVKTFYSEEDIA